MDPKEYVITPEGVVVDEGGAWSKVNVGIVCDNGVERGQRLALAGVRLYKNCEGESVLRFGYRAVQYRREVS